MRPPLPRPFPRSRLAFAAAAALLTGLAGCATAPSPGAPVAQVAPPLRPAVTEDDGEASTYGLFLAGETALGLGSSNDAAAYLARASRSDPQDATLRERAFTANLLAGRVDQAAGFAPAPANGSGALSSLGALTLAVSDMAQGRGKDAAALLARPGLIGAPHAAAALALLPWARLAAGEPAAPPAPVAKPGDLLEQRGLALNRARVNERLGRRAQAEASFKTAVAAATGSGEAALAYGGYLERRGRSTEAASVYDAALQRAPKDAALLAARARAMARGPAPAEPTVAQAAGEALIAPAQAFAARRQPEIGLIYLRLALRLDPSLAPAWLAVGDALDAGGDTRDAVFAWRQVRDDQPEHAQAAGRLAVALQNEGDKPGALTLAAGAAKAAPDDTAVQVVYAELLRDDGRFDDAIAVVDRLVAALPADAKGPATARLYFLRGTLRERAGRWTAAEDDLKRALALQPKDPEYLNYLGFAWADRGEHLKEALAMLQEAAVAQPEDGAIADSVGWARYRLGDVKGAVRELERAVSLAPADPDVNDHLGDAYARAGRRTEALYQWRRVLTLEPDAKLRAAVDAKLRVAATASTT